MASLFETYGIADEPVQAAIEPDKPRTWGEAAKDTGAALLQGGAGLVKSAGDLYGLAAGDMKNPVSEVAKNAQEYWQDAKSDVLKKKMAARDADIKAQEGMGGKAWTAFKDTVTDPALAVDTVAGNAATMIPGAAVGRSIAGAITARSLAAGPITEAVAGAAAKSAGNWGTAGAIAAGGVQQGADVSSNVYDAAMKKPDAVWDTNPDFVAKVQAIGGNTPENRQAVKDELATTAARMTFPAAAAISFAANGIPGANMLERALVGGAARETIKSGVKYALPKAIGKAAFGNSGQEFIEEGGGQFAGNVANRAYVDPNQDLTEQVGENAGMGAAGGFLLGAGGGAFHQPSHVKETGPLSRGANIGIDAAGPIPVEPPPMLLAPEQEQSLLALANARNKALTDKANGTKDVKTTAEDGTPVTIPGKQPEFLTPAEKEEQAFLAEHGGDVQALAQAYPGVLAQPAEQEQQRQQPETSTSRGNDGDNAGAGVESGATDGNGVGANPRGAVADSLGQSGEQAGGSDAGAVTPEKQAITDGYALDKTRDSGVRIFRKTDDAGRHMRAINAEGELITSTSNFGEFTISDSYLDYDGPQAFVVSMDNKRGHLTAKNKESGQLIELSPRADKEFADGIPLAKVLETEFSDAGGIKPDGSKTPHTTTVKKSAPTAKQKSNVTTPVAPAAESLQPKPFDTAAAIAQYRAETLAAQQAEAPSVDELFPLPAAPAVEELPPSPTAIEAKADEIMGLIEAMGGNTSITRESTIALIKDKGMDAADKSIAGFKQHIEKTWKNRNYRSKAESSQQATEAAPTSDVQPVDIKHPKTGKPFTTMPGAMKAQKLAGEGHEVVKVDGGFVVRAKDTNGPSVQAAGLDQPAATGPSDKPGGSGVTPVVEPANERTGELQNTHGPDTSSGQAAPVPPASTGTDSVAPGDWIKPVVGSDKRPRQVDSVGKDGWVYTKSGDSFKPGQFEPTSKPVPTPITGGTGREQGDIPSGNSSTAQLPPTDIRIGDTVRKDGKDYTVTQGIDGGVAATRTVSAQNGVTQEKTIFLKGDEAIRAKLEAATGNSSTAADDNPEWTRLPHADRLALNTRAGMSKLVADKIARTPWADITPKTREKITAAMAAPVRSSETANAPEATPTKDENTDGINDHILALRAVAHKGIKQGGPKGDVRLSTDPSLYAPFDDVVAEARKAVAAGTRPVPFQIHNALDIGIGETDRVIAALSAQKPGELVKQWAGASGKGLDAVTANIEKSKYAKTYPGHDVTVEQAGWKLPNDEPAFKVVVRTKQHAAPAIPKKLTVYRAENSGRGIKTDAIQGGTYYFDNKEAAELWAGDAGNVVEREIETSGASIQDVSEGELIHRGEPVLIRRDPEGSGKILEIVVFDKYKQKTTPAPVDTAQAATESVAKPAQTVESVARAVRQKIAANRRKAREKSRKEYEAKGWKPNSTPESEQADYDTEVNAKLSEYSEKYAAALLGDNPLPLIEMFVNGNFEASEDVFKDITGVKIRGLSAADKKAALYKWAKWTPEQIAKAESDAKERTDRAAEKNKQEDAKTRVMGEWLALSRLQIGEPGQKGMDGQEFVLQAVAKGYDKAHSQKKGIATIYGLTNGKEFTTLKKGAFTDFVKAAIAFGGLDKTLEYVNPPMPQKPAGFVDRSIETGKDAGMIAKAFAPTESETKPTRQKLETIAQRLGFSVNKSTTGWHASGGMISIPSEDADLSSAVSADHVFAHELGHGIMDKRGVSVKGFPDVELRKRVANWDELVAASKEFRPGVHNHTSDSARKHAKKANEIAADAIASVLIGDKPLTMLQPFMDWLGINKVDLGLQTVDEANAESRAAKESESKAPQAPAEPTPAATENVAKPDAKAVLSEREKAAKAKMFNALGKLATLAGKNTRMNWTQEEEQQLLPIVIELFDGAMELGAVTFQQAVAYVREFISTNLDQETSDSIPFDTMQGAYISVAGRHKDKPVTSKKEVVSFESLAELENSAQQADTSAKDTQDATRELDSTSERPPEGAPADKVQGTAPVGPVEGSSNNDGGQRSGSDGNTDGSGVPARRGMGSGKGGTVSTGGGRKQRGSTTKPRVSGNAGSQPGFEFVDNAGGTGGLIPTNPAPNAEPIQAPAFNAQDFTIEDDLGLGEGGAKAKYQGNVEAIRLLAKLDAENRQATPTEQRVLAKYVGWGGLAQAFDENNASWSKEYAELKGLLSPDDYADARTSTRYAHYTSKEIIQDGIYAALRHMGFNGGRALEGGAGVGNFIGLMPTDMRSASRFTAIEREPFSAKIAKHLYPQQNVQEADFTQFIGNDDFYDVAVGNPPFASDQQVDRSGRKHLSGLSLHNYFFAKAVDMLREGGILAQVVTNSFLDAKTDTARQYISDKTKFLGAIRLPNNAFSKNAGTEVTTDLIFLQKRPESEWGGKAAKADAKRWMNIGEYTDAEGRKVALNQYFIDNPQMMLGKFGLYGTMYRGESPALVQKPGQDTGAMLKEAVSNLPAAVYVDKAITNTQVMGDALVKELKNPTVQEGGYFEEDGKLFQRIKDVAGEARGKEITPATQWTEKTKLGDSGFSRIKALSGMRATVRSLLAAELSNDPKMEDLRKTLNEQYDAFRKEHGLINDPGTLRVFDDDPDFPLLASLEHNYTPAIGLAAAKSMGIKMVPATATKGPIFTQRVIDSRKQVQKVETPADALAVSMAERGKLDTKYIGELLNRDPDEVLRELSSGDKPLLFNDPATGEYVMRDAYLSGNVRAKLVQAKQAAMFNNIKALEEVQPEDVGAHEIVARIGSPWVPTTVYEDFAKFLFGDGTNASVKYVKANAGFSAYITAGSATANTNTWGTSNYNGTAILNDLLNNKPIKVTYKDQDGTTHTDVPATEQANAKAQDMRDKFQDWMFTDGDRSELLVRAYNDTNNNYVTRDFDGGWMSFPGKVPDIIIKFRRHQRNAIARIVQDRTALLDHVVGAGKTFTIISAAMELKRTGLAKKPMIAVPNHLVKQWASDFYKLYPSANILTATKKDFEKSNRRKFLAKIATGDWDAVIIAHSSYGFIKPSPDFEEAFNQKQIRNILETIKQVENDDGDKQQKKRTVKQLEGIKERLENRIKALRDKPMDALLDFGEIGVDQLFVDEAHLFKNLMFSTKMQNIAGLGEATGSQRAYDMYVKANQIFEKNGRGQGLVFATGTPVSNSLAEMYHMMRYLMPNEMEEMGFQSFDAWANTFASAEQVWMQKASADGFKAQNRMSNFVNTPELLKIFDQVSDTVTMDDIKKAYSEENEGKEFPLPKLKGGKRTPVSLRKSAAQESYMQQISERASIMEQRKGPPKAGEDNILVIMSDARKAAMDVRLVDQTITTREPGGRIDRSSQEIFARYKQYDSVKGTQLVFSDLGTPLKTVKKELVEYQALQTRIAAATEEVQNRAALGDESSQDIIDDSENAQTELDEKGGDWLGAMQAAERGFSIYDDLKAALVEKGIPENEIAFIHDYNTDDQKAGLFKKMNAGQIRVLLGSTPKLGAGTNVQERLVALHHLDVPWKPSDVEQREGRIIRQGNKLSDSIPGFEVEVLAYVTQDTLDMRMWQVQETKLKMINQLRTRNIGREVDNAFEDLELSAGEMQAAATGNIDLLREIQIKGEIKKMEQRKRAFDAQKSDLQNRKKSVAQKLETLPKKIESSKGMADASDQYKAELAAQEAAFKVTIDGKEYTDQKEAQAILLAMNDAHEYLKKQADGKYGGEPATESRATGENEANKGIDGYVPWAKRPLPVNVNINGDTYTTRASMAEAFSNVRGDKDPIAWKLDGETFKRRTQLEGAIRQSVADSVAEKEVKQIGSIGPFKVSIEGQATDRAEMIDVVLSHGGQAVSNVTTVNQYELKAGGDALSKFVPSVIRIAENLAISARQQHEYEKRQLATALKEKAELDNAPVQGEWPDQAKLEDLRKKHKEVLANLSGVGIQQTLDGETVYGSMGATDTVGNESDVVFSQGLLSPASFGPKPTLDQIQRLVDKVLQVAKNVIPVSVIASPHEIAGVKVPVGTKPTGAVIDGRIYLFADNIGSVGSAYVTLFHEVFHLGLQKVIPAEDYAAMLKQFANSPLVAKYIRLWKDSTEGQQKAKSLPSESYEALANEEALAMVSETLAANDGMGTKNLPGLAKLMLNWLAKVADRIGMPVDFSNWVRDLTRTEAERFVNDMVRAVLGGQKNLTKTQAKYKTEVDGLGGVGTRFSTLGGALTSGMNSVREVGLPAGYKVADLFQGEGRLSYWHKSVGTMYNLAQRSPPFKRVFDSVQNFLNDVSFYAAEAADLAPSILPKLDKITDIAKSPLSAADTKALSRPVFEGTLTWGRDSTGTVKPMEEIEAALEELPLDERAHMLLQGRHVAPAVLRMWQGLPQDQYEAIINGKFEREFMKPGVVFKPAELREHFGMTDAQVAIYQEFRKATDKSIDNLAISEMLNYAGKDALPVREAVLASGSVQEAGQTLRDYLVSLTEMEPERDEALSATAAKMLDIAAHATDMKDRGYAPLSRFGNYTLEATLPTGERYFSLFETDRERNKMARMLTSQGATGLSAGTMSQEAYKLLNGITPETAALFGEMLGLESQGSEAKDLAFQEYIKRGTANRSAMKRLLQRKGIAGFSEDSGRVLAGFIYSNSRRTSSNLHAKETTEAVSAIPKEQGELKDTAVKLHEYVSNPAEEAQAFRGILFAQYLGGSVASAMVNATQPFTVTLPYLTQFGGVKKAAAQMVAAVRDATKDTTGNAALDAALKKAEEEGIVSPQEVHSLQAQAMGRAQLQAGDGTTMGNALAMGNNAISKMSLAWGKVFGLAEQFNRRTTFIAAYRTAIEQGIANPAKFAKKAVMETQFVYNKGNKPRWGRGAIGATLFTFKQYSVNYLEIVHRMATAGEPGSPERAAGRKAAALAIAILFMLAGSEGLPFVEDIEDVLDGALQRMGYNFSSKQSMKAFLVTQLGKDGAEFVTSGISGLPGAPIDVSGRLGMGNLIPGTGLFQKKTDHTRDLMELAGPAGDMIKRTGQATEQLLGGNVVGAAKTIAPTAARNLDKAYDMTKTGMYRDDKGSKIIDTDGFEAVAKAIGFQPRSVKNVQDASREVQKAKAQYTLASGEIRAKMAQAIFMGDDDMKQSARDDVIAWNRNNPDQRMTIDMPTVLRKVREMRKSKEQRIADTAPKALRSQVREQLRGELH